MRCKLVLLTLPTLVAMLTGSRRSRPRLALVTLQLRPGQDGFAVDAIHRPLRDRRRHLHRDDGPKRLGCGHRRDGQRHQSSHPSDGRASLCGKSWHGEILGGFQASPYQSARARHRFNRRSIPKAAMAADAIEQLAGKLHHNGIAAPHPKGECALAPASRRTVISAGVASQAVTAPSCQKAHCCGGAPCAG
jgi:hypothetical protein